MNNKPAIPNLDTVKGILALVFGLLLLGVAFKIILHVVLFVTGFMLIYYGLAVLKIKQATDYIDIVIAKIKRTLWG